jgi:hypothetical protein
MLRKKHKLWPKAQVRLYVTESVLPIVKDDMLSNGVNLFVVTGEPLGFEGTLWRFWAFDDATTPCVSFDADDDLLSASYVDFLREWIASDKPFVVRRTFWHTWALKVNACRIGCKPRAFQNLLGDDFSITDLTRTYCDTGFGTLSVLLVMCGVLSSLESSKQVRDLEPIGVDEGFTNREIWPRIKDHVFLSRPIWTEYNWILIGFVFTAALAVNIGLVANGLTRIREKYDKPGSSSAPKSLVLVAPAPTQEATTLAAPSSDVAISSTDGAPSIRVEAVTHTSSSPLLSTNHPDLLYDV